MEKVFKFGVIVGMLAIAGGLWMQSQNSRYQFSSHGTQGVIVDTRTGQYWTEDGTRFEPLAARITAHHPFVVDNTSDDDRASKYKNCLLDVATGVVKESTDCKALTEPSASVTSHP